jgi:hypothetical protein
MGASEGILGPWSLLLPFHVSSMRWTALLCHMLPPSCPTTGPKQWGQFVMEFETSETVRQNKPFLFISWLSQSFHNCSGKPNSLADIISQDINLYVYICSLSSGIIMKSILQAKTCCNQLIPQTCIKFFSFFLVVVVVVLGFELRTSCLLSSSPFCIGYFWDRVSLYAWDQPGLDPPICASLNRWQASATSSRLRWDLSNFLSGLALNLNPLDISTS